MKILFLTLLASFCPVFLHADQKGMDLLKITCNDKRNLPGDYKPKMEDALQSIGATNVKCTSCYRSPQQQAAACRSICGNPNGCPGLCARPGYSQHQKQQIAVCDFNIPKGNVGCDKLKQLCDSRFGGTCGVAHYGGSAYHFGVNDDHFSAWNKCGYLSGSGRRAQTQKARLQRLREKVRSNKRG